MTTEGLKPHPVSVQFEDCFFFDSYAIIEIIKGNPNYLQFKNSAIATSKLNVFEVFYYLLREFGEGVATNISRYYYNSIIDFDHSILSSAAKFKLENKKQNLSMADCIGYKIAEFLGIKFLTGDSQFKDKPNVEFVK